jgi:hypothetical protein
MTGRRDQVGNGNAVSGIFRHDSRQAQRIPTIKAKTVASVAMIITICWTPLDHAVKDVAMQGCRRPAGKVL